MPIRLFVLCFLAVFWLGTHAQEVRVEHRLKVLLPLESKAGGLRVSQYQDLLADQHSRLPAGQSCASYALGVTGSRNDIMSGKASLPPRTLVLTYDPRVSGDPQSPQTPQGPNKCKRKSCEQTCDNASPPKCTSVCSYTCEGREPTDQEARDALSIRLPGGSASACK